MSARRKRWRGARSEGGRSGSPALLALRWLKAKESARPRTRPGRDLLPSSFLHPALSHRVARRSLTSRGVSTLSRPLLFSLLRSLRSLFPSRRTLLYANNCIMNALLLCGRFRTRVWVTSCPGTKYEKSKKKNRAPRA